MLEAFRQHSGRDAFATWRSGAFAQSSREFSVRCANAHATVQAVGLTMLVGRSSPAAKNVMTRVLEIHLAFPRGAQETSPVGFVEHGDDTTATTYGLVTGDAVYW